MEIMRFAVSLAMVLGSALSTDTCFDKTGKPYSLSWASQGKTFFDTWDFGEIDFTNGAVRYVNRTTAYQENLTQAFDDHAIVRPGGIEDGKRRKSVRLSTQRNFTYFLAAMKFTHTPYGCGVWPAFWSNGASGNWPTDGELDILEYWQSNDKSEVSFHTVESPADGCKLDKAQLNKKGCPHFDDVNNDFSPWMRYDCQTNYSKVPPHLGCAPSTGKRYTGEQYANNPGVIAAEWNREFIKVFYIPEAEIPADLEEGVSPQPDTWDKWIISYYPFAASGCNLTSRSLSSAQAFVLNIELCGGRGSLEFPFGCNGLSMCRNKQYAGPGDCCTEYMTDDKKSSEALSKQAFFNISYIKVWQQEQQESRVKPTVEHDEAFVV